MVTTEAAMDYAVKGSQKEQDRPLRQQLATAQG